MNAPEVAVGSDTESQKQRKRQFGSNEPISAKGRMLLKDVPSEIREVEEGRGAAELPERLDTHVLRAIQQLDQGIREQGNSFGNVQIIVDMIAYCKNELTTSARSGEGKTHPPPNEEDRERARRKRYEFSQKARGDLFQNR